ncbi:hypothetical protein FO519_009277 [Halicephalobus sp. NKZ332]|nr:hypothetical protein FO519_009277 [Halicephalobus sp. NKZ332]
MVTKKFNQTVELITTEHCPDITQGFRCPVKKMGSKLTYKTVPEIKTEKVDDCCDGFYAENDVCKPCTPEKCKKNEPHIAPTDNKSTIGAGVIILLVLLGITVCGVLYYRKKYHKEKDPELPTVTYHPEEKSADVIPVEPHREFQNPLFTRAPQLSEEEKQLEKLKIGTKQNYFMNTSTKSNDYAGLDDISQRPSSSSTSSASSSRAAANQRGPSSPNAEDPCTKPLLETPDNHDSPDNPGSPDIPSKS